MWPHLVKICELEKTTFLPQDVSVIVLQLLQIRHDTFQKCTERYADGYFYPEDYPIEFNEVPTEFYPTLPIIRYPKKYRIAGKNEEDLCFKWFNDHQDFIYGLFSVGCTFEYNVTFGYEIMLNKESSHNLFRFLRTRDVNLNKLEGVLFDFCCNLHPYALNREAEDFELMAVTGLGIKDNV